MDNLGLSEIPSELVRSAVIDTIENQLQFKNYRINVSSASKAGENNFIGIIHRVSITEMIEDKAKKPANKNLIVKSAPQNLLRRSQFVARPAFEREIYMYEKVLPALRHFEQSRVQDADQIGFTEYPKSYRTVDVDVNEGLIFEDLCDQGFKTIDRRTEDVAVEHLRLVMQSLAKLHAISFALNDQQPKLFNELASKLSEVFVCREDKHLRECFTKQAQLAFEAVSNEGDAHLLAKVKELYEKEALDIGADCIDLTLTGPAIVIGHGDAWQNNTMFRYDIDGKPIEVIFLDWQTTRASSPVIDLVYYIFCCTTKTLRDSYYDELLQLYHQKLTEHIKRLGSNPNELFPYQLMLEHLKKFAKFGLVLSTVLLPMITSDVGNGLDLDAIGNDAVDSDGTNSNNFISNASRIKLNTRLRGVIIDMIRLGYI